MNRREMLTSVAGLAIVPLMGPVSAGEPSLSAPDSGAVPWKENPAISDVLRRCSADWRYFSVSRWATRNRDWDRPDNSPVRKPSIEGPFHFLPWRTVRYCFVSDLPLGTAKIAVEKGLSMARSPMAVRTHLAVQLLQTPDWQHAQVPLDRFLSAPLATKEAMIPAGYKLADMILVVGADQVKEGFGPRGRLWGCGVRASVEVSTITMNTLAEYPWSNPLPPPTEKPIWPDGFTALLHAPSSGLGTVHFRFRDRMVAETKPDPDNNRTQARIIEDYNVSLTPKSGLLLTE